MTSTFTPTITPSPQGSNASSRLDFNCLTIHQPPLFDYSLDGSIVFNNAASFDNGRYAPGVILLNLNNQEKVQLEKPEEHILDVKASPDRTQVAYELIKDEGKTHSLVISTSDFQQDKVIVWKDEWEIILGWSDDTHIVFRKTNNDAPIVSSETEPPELIVFNISTLGEEIVKADFPDLLDGFNPIAYDPGFTRAVYMQWTEPSQSTYAYVLWDIKKRQALATQTVVGYPIPKWSPDGLQFITTGLIDLDYREIFSISRNGQIKRLTYLGNYSSDMEIVNYSWSPDGQRIALLLVKENDSKIATIATLDVDTGIITDYCVPITMNGDTYTNTFTPIWSPNSEQVIAQDWFTVDHRRTILVDVIGNYAVQIAEDLEPLAWVKNP